MPLGEQKPHVPTGCLTPAQSSMFLRRAVGFPISNLDAREMLGLVGADAETVDVCRVAADALLAAMGG